MPLSSLGVHDTANMAHCDAAGRGRPLHRLRNRSGSPGRCCFSKFPVGYPACSLSFNFLTWSSITSPQSALAPHRGASDVRRSGSCDRELPWPAPHPPATASSRPCVSTQRWPNAQTGNEETLLPRLQSGQLTLHRTSPGAWCSIPLRSSRRRLRGREKVHCSRSGLLSLSRSTQEHSISQRSCISSVRPARPQVPTSVHVA